MIKHCFYKPFEAKLLDKLTKADATRLYNQYIETGRKLIDKILPNIKVVEGKLTFHGPEHVSHVMKQAFKLIDGHDHLSAHDLFILGLSIMYHDAGNLEGRSHHAEKISYALNTCSPDLGQSGLMLVKDIVKAHGGDDDTIARVSLNPIYEGEVINAREIAAIVRFADELAEGDCRTDIAYIDKIVSGSDSLIFHLYSYNTQVSIMDAGSTISIQYTLELNDINNACCVVCKSNLPDKEYHSIPLEEYLEFTIKRLNKLNAERKYTRKYSRTIAKIDRVRYSISFVDNKSDTITGELNDFALPCDKGEEVNLKSVILDELIGQIGGSCA